MAERYLNLVKVQEWSDLSGKFRTIARYVKHDPNLTTVTIESIKGRGADRTTKEVTVPVDKLSKICQSRVRQIDIVQKKIKEMSPPKPGENGVLAGVPGEIPGGELARRARAGRSARPRRPCRSRQPRPSPIRARRNPIHLVSPKLCSPRPCLPAVKPGRQAVNCRRPLPTSATVAATALLQWRRGRQQTRRIAATAGGFHPACVQECCLFPRILGYPGKLCRLFRLCGS